MGHSDHDLDAACSTLSAALDPLIKTGQVGRQYGVRPGLRISFRTEEGAYNLFSDAPASFTFKKKEIQLEMVPAPGTLMPHGQVPVRPFSVLPSAPRLLYSSCL